VCAVEEEAYEALEAEASQNEAKIKVTSSLKEAVKAMEGAHFCSPRSRHGWESLFAMPFCMALMELDFVTVLLK
jgi:hypothetical protein